MTTHSSIRILSYAAVGVVGALGLGGVAYVASASTPVATVAKGAYSGPPETYVTAAPTTTSTSEAPTTTPPPILFGRPAAPAPAARQVAAPAPAVRAPAPAPAPSAAAGCSVSAPGSMKAGVTYPITLSSPRDDTGFWLHATVGGRMVWQTWTGGGGGTWTYSWAPPVTGQVVFTMTLMNDSRSCSASISVS
jgi:hypothetical protein